MTVRYEGQQGLASFSVWCSTCVDSYGGIPRGPKPLVRHDVGITLDTAITVALEHERTHEDHQEEVCGPLEAAPVAERRIQELQAVKK